MGLSAAFPSSLAIRRTRKYASWLVTLGALHPTSFEQLGKLIEFLRGRAIAFDRGMCYGRKQGGRVYP
ncbi:MAG: hypothetical protein CVU61_14700 [Deltaproteobacteria bacterium HGW-Deltaproteobacteria-19]|nr:MAG: hypothetical protein CVU61_14700 [Deltaproteobacteria bacterium HGW-Deltaproteobacteria-19]